jgi:high-affinity iron transporter
MICLRGTMDEGRDMQRKIETVRIRKFVWIIVVLLATTVMGANVTLVQAKEASKYKGMADEIGTYLTEALSQYKKGNVEGAKLKTQAAYFEVFENLEGPIRVNVSAKTNYELEEEFSAIRKMILRKEPVPAVEKRITDFMARLRSVVSELEGGVELVAEAPKETSPQESTAAVTGAGGIEPAWLEAFENIKAGLGDALEAYKKGDAGKAATLVNQTHFEHYKSSLLETAIRNNISQKKNFEHNSDFSDVEGMIRSGKDPATVEASIGDLIKGLQEDLPGLPLVEGAVSKRVASKSSEREVADKDWAKVTADLFAEIDKAVALYGQGESRDAVRRVQDAYFDVFEASGMEAKIGARDAGFKGALEGHFSLIAGKMKKGASVQELEGPLAALKKDFEKAASMLGKGKDSPLALFVYSLMIILREGFEAILIITAIVAYLVKTDNRDKLKVIYNGCISALVMSVLTAILVKWVLKTSSASQEAMEGATMLLASAVLFSVSYWLISKAEAQKWVAYIKDKVGGSLSSNSLRALWFAAFLAVYREGAETVLFYQALASDSAASGVTAVAGGFVIGCIALAGIYLAMRYGAVKLPIRPFFLFTGALLYYMSFVFAGKGVMELISGKLFEPTLVSWMPTIQFVGVYPYVQTLIPQVIITLAAAAGLGVILNKKGVTVEEASNR